MENSVSNKRRYISKILWLLAIGTAFLVGWKGCNNEQLTFMPNGNETSEQEVLDVFKEESKEFSNSVKQKIVNFLLTEKYNDFDEPVDFATAKILTDEFLVRNPPLNPTQLKNTPKSVHFYKEEILALLSSNGATGMRVYFAKYPSNYLKSDNNPHPYRGMNTVVLRAVNKSTDIKYNAQNRYPADDYGDVCPPNCEIPSFSNISNRKDGDIDDPQRKDGGSFKE